MNDPDRRDASLELTGEELRALLAGAEGEVADYREYRDRYRALARSLGFAGQTKWAEAMP